MVKQPFTITNIDETNNVNVYISSDLAKSYFYQSNDGTTPILISKDNITYRPLLTNFLTGKKPITLRPTEKLFIKIKPNNIHTERFINRIHIISGKAKVSGNIDSLTNPDNSKPLFREFHFLFNDSPTVDEEYLQKLIEQKKCHEYPSIVDASELILPYTDLSDDIYARMFWNCKSLKYPPKILPAYIVPENGYDYMFSGCEKLEYIPKIKAKIFNLNACFNMFSGCTSLKDISNSFPKIFNYTGVNSFAYCFANCIGLEKIPDKLLSKELYRHCFKNMFSNTKVKTIPKLNLSIDKQYKHQFWFEHCYANIFDNIPDEYLKYMSVFQRNLFNDD